MPHVIVKLVPGKIRTGENSTRRSILGNPTMIADASRSAMKLDYLTEMVIDRVASLAFGQVQFLPCVYLRKSRTIYS
jgi:hypothetical protein